MLLKTVIATLHNDKTDRWHPIFFVESPLPGDCLAVRYKSKGHHTDGFDQNARHTPSLRAGKDSALCEAELFSCIQ